MMLNFFDNVRYATAGIRSFFKTEKNGRIQGVIAILVILCGFIAGVTRIEWICLLVCIAVVLCLEMVNSSIEKVCNLITTDYHPTIKIIKDMCAGAVLLASIVSAIIGCIIFLPYLTLFFT